MCPNLLNYHLLGKPFGYKLAYHYSDSPQRPARPKHVHKFGFLERDIPRFGFATPYTLMTWNSLQDLNEKLESPICNQRFRSNIIIQSDEKKPFPEDEWTKRLR